jgi:hypothetical protein
VAYALWQLKPRWRDILLVPLLGLIGFVIGTPYLLFELPLFFRDMNDAVGSHVVNAPQSVVQFLTPLRQYAFACGSVMSLACVAGLVRALWKRHPAAILAALYLIPYLFLVGKSPFNVTRYLNETLPFLLPFAGLTFGASFLAPAWCRVYQLALFLLCLSQVPYTLAINRSLAGEPDPRDQASEWVRRNIPAGSVVGLPQQADFMVPGHLYMQYWKGVRYPAASVRPPNYKIVLWDAQRKRWPDPKMGYWVEHNLNSGLGFKSAAYVADRQQNLAAMKQGFHPVATFERTLRWGPFDYGLPDATGYDWVIFFPTITVNAKNL